MYANVKTLLVMALAIICVAVIFSPAFTAAQTTRPAPVTSPDVKKPGAAPLPDLIVAKFTINKSSFRKVDSKTYGVKFTATLKNIGKGMVDKTFYVTIQRYDQGAGTWKNTALGKTKNCYKITAPIAPKGSMTVNKELHLTHAELSLPERSRKELKLRVLVDAACKGETPSSQFLGPQSHILEAIESNNYSPFVMLAPNLDLVFDPGQIPIPILQCPLLLQCHGHPVTICGTSGDDTIQGTSDNDVIHGRGGDDYINGLGSDDIICGGDGDDTLFGDDDDELYGNGGIDHLYGGDGDDKLWGGDDNDTLKGGKGVDELYGENGRDELYGELGNDELYGNDGNDELYGGPDDDLLEGGDDDDELYGNAGKDRLHGGSNEDKLEGGDDDDELKGGCDDDTLYGEGGDDTLYGEGGNDTLWGGPGNDWMYAAWEWGDWGMGGNDRLYGGPDNDHLWGGNGQDILYGNEGVDELAGMGGNDDLCDGGPGTDTYGFGGGANGGCEQTVSIP